MTKTLETIAGAADRPLKIGEIEIPCYVLEDETRVVSQRGNPVLAFLWVAANKSARPGWQNL